MPPTLLADIEDLKLRLHTSGTVQGGAALNTALLEALLEEASARLIAELPERTLVPEPPDVDDDPLERRFPARRVVQVPDLRAVDELRFDDRDPIADVDAYELVRSRESEPALWIKFWRGDYLGARRLIIVGHWGPAEPNVIARGAALTWAARAYHQRSARFSDTHQGQDGSVQGYFRQIPGDVLAAVNELTVPGV